MEDNKALKIFQNRTYATKIILFAVILQIVLFIYNLIFGQMHIDEVMLMLNARSLADSGCDILGERMPIYFDTWIYGGQSPLPTYISALIIKLFGYRLWVARLPILLVYSVALIAFAKLMQAVCRNNIALANLAITFYALQPARIFNSLWVLDCAYFAAFFIIGMYFLNSFMSCDRKKALHLFLSMLFFALACYSYITSVIILPVFLLTYYLIMLRKGRVTFLQSVAAALILAVFMLPFVLFGLVQFGVVSDLKLLGFSFSKMEAYVSSSSLIFNTGKVNVLSYIAGSIKGLFSLVLLPDESLIIGYFNNTVYGNFDYYSYGHAVSVIAIIAFAVFALKKARGNKKISATDELKALVLSFAVSFAVFGLIVKWDSSSLHRYALFFVLFNVLSAAGAYALLKKKADTNFKNFKSLLVMLIVFSAALTSLGVYNFANVRITSLTTNGVESAFDYAEEHNCDSVSIISDNRFFKERCSVYLRYRYFDELSEFESLETELKNNYSKEILNGTSEINIKKDGSIRFDTPEGADGDAVVIHIDYLRSHPELTDSFEVIEDYGCVVVAERKA